MKVVLLICFTFLSNLYFSQSKEISSSYDKIGKFSDGYAFVYKGNLIGIINIDGKEIIKPEYDKLSSFGSDNIAYSTKKGLMGLINKEGKVIIDNIYDNIGSFKNSTAFVKKGNLYGVVNKEGKILIDVKYSKLKYEDGGVIRATKADGNMVLIKPGK